MDMARSWLCAAACRGCAVRGEAVCSGLSGPPFEAFSAMVRRRRLARNQVLAWEGEESRFVGTLLSGALKLSGGTGDGREQIVGLVWPSDFVGNALGGISPFRVTALAESELCLFERTEFLRFADGEPGLERDLLRRALDDLGRARSFMLLLGRVSAAERIAALLLDIADRAAAKSSGTVRLVLPFRRQEMADVLGLTVETVSRQLRRLIDAGIIAVPDRRTILLEDRERLERMAA